MVRATLIAAALLAMTSAGVSAGVVDDVKVATAGAADADEAPAENTSETICSLIESSAARHRIPVDFFTRLIWKESTFRPAVVSPKGAQGIAQFMPGTASLRGLADPFDPAEAIPASAHYLSDLSARFGNLGLAAAAYNAGEKRVGDWLRGESGLPWETRDYVFAITARSAESWTHPDPNLIAGGAPPDLKPAVGCLALAAILAKPGAGSAIVERIPQGPWAPWGVQVAGNFSLNRAMAGYAAIQDRHPAVLAGHAPMVVRTVSRSRGRAPLFQIRVPAPTREEASRLCRSLQSAGGACVVVKN